MLAKPNVVEMFPRRAKTSAEIAELMRIADETPRDELRAMMEAHALDVRRKMSAQEAEENRQAQAERREMSADRANIPASNSNASLDDPVANAEHFAARQNLKAFVENYRHRTDGKYSNIGHMHLGTSLVLHGTPGTGKSRDAAAVMLALEPELDARWPTRRCIYASQDFIIGRVMRSSEAMEEYVTAPLLVIDDLGIKAVTNVQVQGKLCELLKERHDALRTTIITTNKTAPQLADFLDERIASRFSMQKMSDGKWSAPKPSGVWKFLSYTWADYRMGDVSL
jgi:DNA replication protein DnaC